MFRKLVIAIVKHQKLQEKLQIAVVTKLRQHAVEWLKKRKNYDYIYLINSRTADYLTIGNWWTDVIIFKGNICP